MVVLKFKDYYKRLIRKIPILKNGLVLLHIVSVIIGFAIFIASYQTAENLLVQQNLSKQMILAKAGSLSAENLIKNVQNQLSSFIFSFTDLNENINVNKKATRAEFAAYMQRAQLPVNSISMYDEVGKLSILENRNHIYTGENQDFSQTELIKWSKNPESKNKTFISTPYIGTTGASVGKIIIIIAKPIYFGSIYKGTLAVRLLVNDFRNDFITALVSGNDEDSFIVNSAGVLLAGNSSLTNQNLYSYAGKKKWNGSADFTKKLNAALKTNSLQTNWIFQNPGDKPKDLLVGISKIDIPNTDRDLFFAATSSRDKALASLKSLSAYGYAWLGFGVLTTTTGGLLVIFLRSGAI